MDSWIDSLAISRSLVSKLPEATTVDAVEGDSGENVSEEEKAASECDWGCGRIVVAMLGLDSWNSLLVHKFTG